MTTLERSATAALKENSPENHLKFYIEGKTEMQELWGPFNQLWEMAQMQFHEDGRAAFVTQAQQMLGKIQGLDALFTRLLHWRKVNAFALKERGRLDGKQYTIEINDYSLLFQISSHIARLYDLIRYAEGMRDMTKDEHGLWGHDKLKAENLEVLAVQMGTQVKDVVNRLIESGLYKEFIIGNEYPSMNGVRWSVTRELARQSLDLDDSAQS